MKCKVCSDCGNEKPIQAFRLKDGKPERRCVPCAKRKAYEYYHRNKAKIKARNDVWREENKEALTAYRKRYWEHNRKRLLELNRRWRENNKDKINARYRANYKPCGKPKLSHEERHARRTAAIAEWRSKNKDKVAEYKKRYYEKNKDRLNSARREQRRNQRARQREDVLLDIWDHGERTSAAVARALEVGDSTHSKRPRKGAAC